MISALYSLYKKQICHWDIKPDNILIDLSKDPEFIDQNFSGEIDWSKFNSETKFVAKLADFGASWSLERMSVLTI